MVSPSKPNHSRVASQQHSHKCKLIKGPKPLTHFKFYLDIEKHQLQSKIEKAIQELGGSIEFLLVEEVTHFVTDKHIDRDGKVLSVHHQSPISQVTSKTPQKSQTSIPSLLLTDLTDIVSPNGNSNDARATCSKPKSRADAMLQRARSVQQQSAYENSVRCNSSNLSQNSIQLAQTWGTTIWTTEYTLKFLDKVSIAVKLEFRNRYAGICSNTTAAITAKDPNASTHLLGSKSKAAHAKHLKGDYIKIESLQRHYRPYYQEFKSWPKINLNATVGYSPFQVPSDRAIPQKFNNNAISSVKPKQTANKTGNQNSANVVTATIDVTNTNSNLNKSLNKEADTMTRKTRNKQVRESVDACSIKTNNDIIKRTSDKCGYCEKCRVEYDVLSIHLQSKEHLNFVKNNDNYLALDNLINSGANVETFLKMNSRSHKTPLSSPTTETNSKLPETDIDNNGLFGCNYKSSAGSNHILHNSRNANSRIDSELDHDTASVNVYRQTNGVSNDEQMPPKISSGRDKLPKYSPPITRRSHTKQPTTNEKITSKANANKSVKDFDSGDEVKDRHESNKRLNHADHKDEQSTIVDMLRSRSPLNGNKKNDVQIEQAEDQESPQMKRIIRSFPRYKVIDGVHVEASSKADHILVEQQKIAESKESSSGIIVKFKRVRESELSKLTFEADNFMFPKQRDEVPTDDDRQSTSERAADISSDIVSSELDESRLASPTRKSSLSEMSDLFTSSGRRKKRRTQFDSFITEQKQNVSANRKRKGPAQQTVQESPLRSRSNSAKIDETPTVTPTKRAAAIKAQAKTKVTRRSTKRAAAKAAETETVADEKPTNDGQDDEKQSDDRVPEKTYMGSNILSTDFFKSLKFSFERVPNNEPWFSTFQRQDESRERIFEYWGNTAYRKLPFELGPLPPLQSDCCILSKLAALKAARQQKNKRGTKANRAKSQGESTESGNPSSCSRIGNDADSTTVSTTITRSTPKPELNTTVADSTVTATKKLFTCEEPKGGKKSRSSSISKAGLGENASNAASLPASLPLKKRAALLDAFGQPRKSPREHASTLAILSSLVQQRRKRIKELNGGISPEKMPNYSQTNGTTEVTDNDENDDDVDDFCDNDSFQMKDDVVDDQQSRDSNSNCKSNNASSLDSKYTLPEANAVGASIVAPCDKVFRLRKGRRQTASTSSNNDAPSVSSKQEEPTDSQQSENKDMIFPKMPVDDYVDPNKVVRQIDELLASCCTDKNADLDEIAVPLNAETDCVDLLLGNTPKDLVEIISSIKEGPLTYRSFSNASKKTGLSSFVQRGKKRHINKTGWPSLPRKRLTVKKEKAEGSGDDDTLGVQSNTEDEENSQNIGGACEGERDRIDISSRLLQNKGNEFFMQARASLTTPTLSVKEENDEETEPDENEADDGDEGGDEDDGDDDDEAATFCVDPEYTVNNAFASSSEKTENSDIFTVSSDSLDTADLPNDNSLKSKTSMIQIREDDESIDESDDESTSDATTVAQLVSKKKNNVRRAAVAKVVNNVMSTRGKMETRAKGSPLNHMLQPVVCVKKMTERDLYRRTHGNSLKQTKTSPTSPSSSQQVAATNNSDRKSSSPKVKVSPRKLRKPRGKWYREH